MPLGYVRGSGAPQDCICFAEWKFEDGQIVWLFTSGAEFSRTLIPDTVMLEDVGEFYKDPNPELKHALHYFCISDDFAIVAEKDNRAELDRLEKEVKKYIFKREMNKRVLERDAIWTELRRVETEIGNLWSSLL
jgi:hypothetical protein